jgi:alkaline phosphatase D
MKILFFCFALLCGNVGAQTLQIAFGSCSHQNQALPILQQIGDLKPDYFLFLGDNIYGDTRDSTILKQKYDQLGKNSNYQYLKSQTKILATWDDHDYGENDAGKHYPLKEVSKSIFLNFFEEPRGSSRFQHEGIYTSYIIKKNRKRIQVILLDTRTFRSDLTRFNPAEHAKDSVFFYDLEYVPTVFADSTMLGEQQWRWLKKELGKKADIRIIASSTQFAHSYNGYESWNNFPEEKQRMFETIKNAKANGVLFISGDVHYAELSKDRVAGLYPIHDLTASGISQSWHFATPNTQRTQGPVMENHFGLIQIDCKSQTVKLSIIDQQKTERIQELIPWKSLQIAN